MLDEGYKGTLHYFCSFSVSLKLVQSKKFKIKHIKMCSLEVATKSGQGS